jgi:CheY-like chemotaxis protein
MAKLMLVEDDNNLREIYEARLQAEGYDIVTAKDGEEALVVAKAEKPDLIISDVMMPKISGFEMLDILRNTDGLKEVKVIMLTALGQTDDQQRADKLGADRYLVKSQVTLEDIVKVAHELLGDGAAPAAVAVAASTDATTTADDTTTEPPAEPPVEPPATPPSDTPAEPPAAPPADPPAETPLPPTEETKQQSTAQEEASIEAKIEDFVAGATEEAPPPATPPPAAESIKSETETVQAETAADAPAPEPATAPAPEPEPAPAPTPESSTEATNEAADAAAAQKLMDDAVNDLEASAEDQAEEAAGTAEETEQPPAEPVQAAPAPEQAPVPAQVITPGSSGTSTPTAAGEKVVTPTELPASEAAPQKTEGTSSSHVPIAHKKVITPLESDSEKKDINALLAAEEAKESGGQVQPSEPMPNAIIATDEKGASQVPLGETDKDDKVDPNSIAL